MAEILPLEYGFTYLAWGGESKDLRMKDLIRDSPKILAKKLVYRSIDNTDNIYTVFVSTYGMN